MKACQIENSMNIKSFELIKSINRKMVFFYLKRITLESIVKQFCINEKVYFNSTTI